MGYEYANIHQYIAAIKEELDPKNIASPGRLVNMKNIERMVTQRAAAETAHPPAPDLSSRAGSAVPGH
ncbi:MAG: hypothetical protein AB1597_09195 [Chloroflexota bacterium]